MAGLISRFVIAPLDVIKIRLQVQCWQTSPEPSKYVGIVRSARMIARQEGLKGFWKGNLAAEALYLTYGACQFYLYDKAKASMGRWQMARFNTVNSTAISFVAGGSAGMFATMVTYPLDLLRTRFACQGKRKLYANYADAMRQIVANEGVQGFYRGIGPSLAQIVPYMALMFWTYDSVKLRITNRFGKINGALADATSGAIAGMLSKTGVYPLDTVRKRLQVQGPARTQYVIPSVPLHTRGTWHTIMEIVKREGTLALYKGLGPTLLKTAPATAVTFLVYGRTKELFLRLNERHRQ